MKIYLNPVDGRKSFYNKAYVDLVDDHEAVLYSYETPVARIKDGVFYRLLSGWSATTARHVNSFRDRYGMRSICKADWDKMEVA